MKTNSFFLLSAIAIGTISGSQVLANTIESSKSLSPEATIDRSNKVAIYQNNEVICNDTTYARAETAGYHANICGDSNGPNRYVGSGKSGQAIILPLQSASPGRYTAVSGTIRYTLTPDYLTVTRSGRTILKQRVTAWK